MASFWAELRRRNVVRVAIAYSAAVWAILQVADLVLSNLGAPDWIIRVLIVSAAIGFPIAVLLAWYFEITAEGIVAADDVPAGAARRFSGRQVNYAIIGLLTIAIAFLVVDNYMLVDAPREPSIAVLPFTNLSESGDDSAEFFSVGMHDALLTQLAKLGGLKVISRTSVLEYANRGRSIPEIAEALGVAAIMEASVLRSGDRLQVNAQLINGETDGHLWGEIFERELTAENVFAVQREMATSIAGILRATLTPEEQGALDRVPTLNERALQAFYTGNDFARRPNERESMPLAAEAYQRAVDEDENFVEAWAGLARAHTEMFGFGGERNNPERALLASRALERARALDPDAPEVHMAAGLYQMWVAEDIDQALVEYEAALRGLPGSADVFNSLSSIYRRLGRYEDSLAMRLRAMEIDPRNVDALVSLGGGTYARMRNYDDTAATLDLALEIAPDNAMLYWVTAQVPLWRDGDVSAIHALLANPPVELGRFGVRMGVAAARYDGNYQEIVEILEGPNAEDISARNRLLWLGEAYRQLGEDAAANRQYHELLDVASAGLGRNPDDTRNFVYQGAAYAGLGQREAAIDAGRRALAISTSLVDPDQLERVREDLVLEVFAPLGATVLAIETLDALLSGPGVFSIEGLLPDPRLDAIRNDPQFEELVERFRRAPAGPDSWSAN